MSTDTHLDSKLKDLTLSEFVDIASGLLDLEGELDERIVTILHILETYRTVWDAITEVAFKFVYKNCMGDIDAETLSLMRDMFSVLFDNHNEVLANLIVRYRLLNGEHITVSMYMYENEWYINQDTLHGVKIDGYTFDAPFQIQYGKRIEGYVRDCIQSSRQPSLIVDMKIVNDHVNFSNIRIGE